MLREGRGVIRIANHDCPTERTPGMCGMPSPAYETLRADIIVAMKARDSASITALRTADATIKRAAMDANVEIDDALVLTTLRKAVKNLTDAKSEFAVGGRADLVAANEAEIRILERYLPRALPPEQVEALLTEAIRASGATSRKELGKVIAALKQRPEAAQLDFGAISRQLQSRLT